MIPGYYTIEQPVCGYMINFMPMKPTEEKIPICDYEGSDYQVSFWDQGGREYEDEVEAVALQRLLPATGKILLEIGAGAGRNTPRYQNVDKVVLVDYSTTQLQQAQQRLGRSERFIYVAANVYKLPFRSGIFDIATMIRVLHHLVEGPKALQEIRRVLQPGAVFILEYANKQNLKAIFRWLLKKQTWNPFSKEPVEYNKLNLNFHPSTTAEWLEYAGFAVQRQLTVSHFRIGFIKKIVPTRVLVWLDSLAQLTGDWWQVTPSVFVRSQADALGQRDESDSIFECPNCHSTKLMFNPGKIQCTSCRKIFPEENGIFDFR